MRQSLTVLESRQFHFQLSLRHGHDLPLGLLVLGEELGNGSQAAFQ